MLTRPLAAILAAAVLAACSDSGGTAPDLTPLAGDYVAIRADGAPLPASIAVVDTCPAGRQERTIRSGYLMLSDTGSFYFVHGRLEPCTPPLSACGYDVLGTYRVNDGRIVFEAVEASGSPHCPEDMPVRLTDAGFGLDTISVQYSAGSTGASFRLTLVPEP